MSEAEPPSDRGGTGQEPAGLMAPEHHKEPGVLFLVALEGGCPICGMAPGQTQMSRNSAT